MSSHVVSRTITLVEEGPIVRYEPLLKCTSCNSKLIYDGIRDLLYCVRHGEQFVLLDE